MPQAHPAGSSCCVNGLCSSASFVSGKRLKKTPEKKTGNKGKLTAKGEGRGGKWEHFLLLHLRLTKPFFGFLQTVRQTLHF